MQQLRMLKIMDEVKPYPLHPDYFIRTIDPSNQADIEAWVEVCRDGLLSEHAGLDSYTSCITNFEGAKPEQDVFFVCEKATGKPVMTLSAIVRPDGTGYIHMVGSLPECRGKRLSHALLAHGLAKLKAQGAPIATLSTDDFRRPAIKGYLMAGFRPVMCGDDMPERWKVIFDEMNIEDRTMLTPEGKVWEG